MSEESWVESLGRTIAVWMVGFVILAFGIAVIHWMLQSGSIITIVEAFQMLLVSIIGVLILIALPYAIGFIFLNLFVRSDK